MNPITEDEAQALILAKELSEDKRINIYKRLNFNDIERADRNLQNLAGEDDVRELFSKVIYKMLLTIQDSPDPDNALINWGRFTEALVDKYSFFSELIEDSSVIDYLTIIFSSSQFLSEILIKNPEYFDWLIVENNLKIDKTLSDYQEEANSLIKVFKKRDKAKSSLCRFKRREIMRIALRDLLGLADFRNVVSELSNLANSIITAIVELCYEEMVKSYGRPICENQELKGKESSYAVVAMGKLGGCELNFSSDIDLMFIYEDEGETSGVTSLPQKLRDESRTTSKGKIVTNHEFFCKLTERVIGMLSEIDSEGSLYRTDIRLRPEGGRGPVARSLESYRIYYFTQGRIWEKLALLKARCIYGDAEFHKLFYQLADAFKFSDIIPDELISETAKLKEIIDGKLKDTDDYYREVKRGYGGIREIEFVCGVFQVLFGRVNPELRCLSTLDTIQKLKKLNLVTQEDGKLLEEAYIFLRSLEHRLQVVNELQTHTIPKAKYDLRKLAKRLNFNFSDDEEAENLLMSMYLRVTEYVHNIYKKVIEVDKGKDKFTELNVFFNEHLDKDMCFKILKQYNFADLESVLNVIKQLSSGSGEIYISDSARKLFEEIFPDLLISCSDSPFPDKAITFFEEFIEAYKTRDYIYQILKANRKVLELLIKVFGTSDFLSRQMIAHPEIFDMIAEPELLSLSQPIEEKETILKSNLESLNTFEKKMTYLRKERKLNVILVGINDLLNIIDWEEASKRLSELARTLFKIVFELVEQSYKLKYGDPRIDKLGNGLKPFPTKSKMCLVALGKLGGNEVTYHSDLDIISIYFGDGYTNGENSIDNFTYFSKLTADVIKALSDMGEEGYIYKVDARLRPEGKNAPITAPIERYYDYYENKAMLWEYQSFLKADYLVGDKSLAEEFINNVKRIIIKNVSKFNIRNNILDMKKRLEEKDKLPDWALSDIKNGRGGISDIDFLIQYLQLKYCNSYSDIFEANSLRALEKLFHFNILDESTYKELKNLYIFLRRIDSRTRLIFYPQFGLFPKKDYKYQALSKSLKMESEKTDSLKKLFIDYSSLLRETFLRIVSK